jgi:hypothetical protein
MNNTWPFKTLETHVSCYSNGCPLVFKCEANAFRPEVYKLGYRNIMKTDNNAPWYINFKTYDINTTEYVPYNLTAIPIKILDNSVDPRITFYVLHYKADVGTMISRNSELYDSKKHKFTFSLDKYFSETY